MAPKGKESNDTRSIIGSIVTSTPKIGAVYKDPKTLLLDLFEGQYDQL